MEPALRPMSLGEILDRTAQLYRTNFVLFAGIFVPYAGWALVLGLLLLGLRQWLRAAHLAQSLLWLRLTLVGVEWLVLFLAVGAAVAATNRAVAWVHLGEPATIRGAYRSILPRLGRYLWLMTFTFFVVWTPMALLYLGFFGAAAYFHIGQLARSTGTSHPPDSHATLLFGIISIAFFLLMIPAFIYAILMGLRYALALPACVLEDLKAMTAIRRGIDLSKGGRGRIFVLGLLVGVIKLGIVLLSQAFVFVLAFKHHGQLSVGVSATSQVISFFTNIFLGPIYATGITLLYYDQRVRREGYDIEWMMQSAGLNLAPAEAPAQGPPAEMADARAYEPAAEPAFSAEPASQPEEAEGAHG